MARGKLSPPGTGRRPSGLGRGRIRHEHRVDVRLQKKADLIWRNAALLYDRAATSKAPKIWVAPGLHGQEAETVRRGEDGAKRTGVKYSPRLAQALLGRTNLTNTALETLPHEWKHTVQRDRPVTRKNEWETEGQAEAFAREHAPSIFKKSGIKYHNPRFSGYPRATRAVRRRRGRGWIEQGLQQPLFGPNAEDNPRAAQKAFHHNKKWAKPGPTGYFTKLPREQERSFREWVKRNHVPVDKSYDMRGYWLWHAKRGTLKEATTGSGGAHFPDAFKTPFDPTFSKWSKYAKNGTPLDWKGDRLVNLNNHRVIFGG